MMPKLNSRIRFFVRWSDAERAGTVTRIGHNVVWIGAGCYHFDDLRNVREVAL